MHPRPGPVPTSHGIPIDIPRGTVPGGTRSTRMRRRRTRSGGVGGRAGAVSGRRRARRTAAQRRREYSRPVGGVRIGVPGRAAQA
jgi:hypothetical protein